MATISLCMIVKNEEKVLERCLECLKDIVDEMIIVDTGSTDATKEIAGKYTDKIYDFPWIDDFSAARNFSFSKASMDYIYVADADEIIDEENRTRFKLLKQALLPEIEIVQMKYCNQLEFGSVYNFDIEYRGKLYKRLRTFQWIDPIHETIKTEPVIFDSDIEIIHKPLQSHGKRDFAIFTKILNRGERLSKKLLDMYAKELFISGTPEDFFQAEEFFKSSLKEERSLEEYKVADCVLAKICFLRKDWEGFFTACLKEVADNPPAEICTLIGEYYRLKENFEEALMWYFNAIHEQECILSIQYSKKIPTEGMIECYEKLGMDSQAEEYKELLKE
ncbi:MAG: glycosyltransferase family 2 protein [Lachnospiraceae bacterium]|nr:glycosyltransferase family 2 protein [Lachnospiraceae bacterium]